MRTKLLRAVLTQYDGFAEPKDVRGRRLRPEFDFEELRHVFHTGGSPTTVAEVAFGFALYDADDAVLQISACFRLTFESASEPAEPERQEILCELAPREAWPLFRSHVDRILSEMGFPPYHGSRQLTPVLESLAREVLADTVAVDRQLALEAAGRRPRGA